MADQIKCSQCGQDVEDSKTNFRCKDFHAALQDPDVVSIYARDSSIHSPDRLPAELTKAEAADFVKWLTKIIKIMED